MIRIPISMPKTCSDCPCLRTHFSHAWCAVLNDELAEIDGAVHGGIDGFNIFRGRPSKCPLLEDGE